INMIKNKFVRRKITLIQNELSQLEPFKDLTLDSVASDFIKQAAVERIFERIVMRALDINSHLISELADKKTSPPLNYRETFTKLCEFSIYSKEFGQEISKSVGTRNVLVHEYDEVDYTKVYIKISDFLNGYRQYCQHLLDFLEKQL
ncbi:MAG: DUF86 domain-containing protein, partial [Patescibacteria group bacterium]